MTDNEINYLIFFWENAKITLDERKRLKEQFEELYDRFVPPKFSLCHPDTIPAPPLGYTPTSSFDIKNPLLPKDPIVPIISQPFNSDIIFADLNYLCIDDGYQDGHTASQLL